MKQTTYILLILLVYPFFSNAQKKMTTDDGLNLVNLSTSLLSPDGESIIYGKSELDWDKNKRKTTYYKLQVSDQETYQFFGKTGASSMQYSPDGKYISLKRKGKEFQQIFLMRTTGGEAVQATKHINAVKEYKWSADGQKIYFASNRPASKEEKKAKKEGYDHVVIDEGPNGQRTGNWEYLYVFDLKTKKIKQLTGGEMIIGSWDVSPDQSKIVFTARKENRRNQGNLSEIYLFQIKDSTYTQLTDNQAPEGSILFAPDGKKFAYTASGTDRWELINRKMWVMDLTTKKAKILSSAFEGNIRSSMFWSPDSKYIYFAGLQKTVSNIFKMDVEQATFTMLSNNQKGNLSLLDMSKDRNTLLLSYNDAQTPRDLHISKLSNFEPQQMTDLNPGFGEKFALAQAQVVQWKSKDGLEIEGMLYLPPNYDKNKKYPLLLHIHGGPAGVFTNSFSYRYHVWANLGYVQLCPNVRGSSGYSDKFLQGNMKDIGGMDYEDLMTGVDYLIQENMIDPDKMAVRGWSYGGILGGTTVTKTNRFKAASLGAMVSDWTSEYGIGFNYDVRLWYIGGTPWENPEGYRTKSALTNAKNIETPVILFHGANDRTDTEAQSMMFFAALKDMGKTVRYLQFPREPHGFREPRHQRTRDVEEIKWIQKYTLGLDWEADKPQTKEAEKDSSESREE